MKKILLATVIAILTASSEADQGKQNACKYVREQIPQQADNIKSVEVIGVDSVLTTLLLSFGASEIYTEKTKLLDNEISSDQWLTFVDSMMTVGSDVTHSWIMDKSDNDSLRLLPKYKGSWRKAYMVQVTMKSGATKQYRVCMDQDGVTPAMTADDIVKKSEEFYNAFN